MDSERNVPIYDAKGREGPVGGTISAPKEGDKVEAKPNRPIDIKDLFDALGPVTIVDLDEVDEDSEDNPASSAAQILRNKENYVPPTPGDLLSRSGPGQSDRKDGPILFDAGGLEGPVGGTISAPKEGDKVEAKPNRPIDIKDLFDALGPVTIVDLDEVDEDSEDNPFNRILSRGEHAVDYESLDDDLESVINVLLSEVLGDDYEFDDPDSIGELFRNRIGLESEREDEPMVLPGVVTRVREDRGGGGYRDLDEAGNEVAVIDDEGLGYYLSAAGEVVVREKLQNGTILTTHANGDLTYENLDGTKSHVTKAGYTKEQARDEVTGDLYEASSDGSLKVTRGDGTYDKFNADGSTDRAYKNELGELVEEWADGSRLIVSGDGSEEYTDRTGYGWKTVKAADGAFATAYTDGGIEMEASDKSWKISVAPNGEKTVTITLDNGIHRMKMANGGVQEYDPATKATVFVTPTGDRYLTEKKPGGTVMVTDPRGNVTESNSDTGQTTITYNDGSQQTTERLANGSMATTLPSGEMIVTAVDGSQTFIDERGSVTETTLTADGAKVTTGSDGTQMKQSTSAIGVLTAAYATAAPPEDEDVAEGETVKASPVPQGVRQDPNTGETTVITSSGKTVGHVLTKDGVLQMQSAPAEKKPDTTTSGGGEAATDSDDVPEKETDRIGVINPSKGEIVTQGGKVIVESKSTESGGVVISVARKDDEADDEPATVAISPDRSKHQIVSPGGHKATATTSENNVVVDMDSQPMQKALDNLPVDAPQAVLAGDGTELVAVWTLDESNLRQFKLIGPDGEEATKANGEPYTDEDLTAILVPLKKK